MPPLPRPLLRSRYRLPIYIAACSVWTVGLGYVVHTNIKNMPRSPTYEEYYNIKDDDDDKHAEMCLARLQADIAAYTKEINKEINK
jgi:hypothetical protein